MPTERDNDYALRKVLTEAIVTLAIYTMATAAILSILAVVGSKTGMLADLDATQKFLIMSGYGAASGLSIYVFATAGFILKKVGGRRRKA